MGLSNIVRGKAFKNFMSKLYGWGASVVILGALFKINHYPGANLMLIIGLGTEAIIFFFSAFEPPFVDPDWSLVYPELAGLYHGQKVDEELLTKKKKGSVTEELDGMLEKAKIGPDLIESLGKGLRSLSDNTSKLSDVSNAALATNDYVKSVQNASVSVSELTNSYKKTAEALNQESTVSNDYFNSVKQAAQSAANLSSSYEQAAEMLKVDGKAYSENIKKIANNLTALNAMYEMQLQGTNQQAEATTKLQKSLDQFLNNLNESAELTNKYKDGITNLTSNISALNKVYGNMLSAMTFKG